jgi:hypothetical protein
VSREAIVAAAVAELGADTHDKRVRIWESALGREVTYEEIHKLAWCGGFALFCLHAAGLAKKTFWRLGAGFLLQPPTPLRTVKVPSPGDIGYQNSPFQHHFIVESVDGTLVHSIDGNQPDVRRRLRSLGGGIVYYSIAPFIDQEDTLPTIPAPPAHATPGALQHALNSLMVAHPLEHEGPLLLVDGIIGPKTEAAIKWAQMLLKQPGADPYTLLGLT